jgi:hypothetical protein
MLIRLVGADLFHVDREMERHDKLTVSFQIFATAPKMTLNFPEHSVRFYKLRVEVVRLVM